MNHLRSQLALPGPTPHSPSLKRTKHPKRSFSFVDFLSERSEIWPHWSAPFCLTQKEGSHSWNPPPDGAARAHFFALTWSPTVGKHMVVCKGSNVRFTRVMYTRPEGETAVLSSVVCRDFICRDAGAHYSSPSRNDRKGSGNVFLPPPRYHQDIQLISTVCEQHLAFKRPSIMHHASRTSRGESNFSNSKA
jgi:hypothetical protein